MTEVKLSVPASFVLADETLRRLALSQLNPDDLKSQRDFNDATHRLVKSAAQLTVGDLATLQAKSVVDKDPRLNQFVLDEFRRRRSPQTTTS